MPSFIRELEALSSLSACYGLRIASVAGTAVRSWTIKVIHLTSSRSFLLSRLDKTSSHQLRNCPSLDSKFNTVAMPTATKPPVKPLTSISKTSPKSPKPVLPALITPSSATFPKSATFPSQIPQSPAQGDRLEIIKQEDNDLTKTPLTPPTAYTDFLKAFSPALSTPSTGRSPLFDKAPYSSGLTTPITQPTSAASCMSPLRTSCASAPMMPRSPYMRPPNSARSYRGPLSSRPKLYIPQSPLWSPVADSPKSCALHVNMSPADWSAVDAKRRWCESPKSATVSTENNSVCVKQVIKRTITVTKTPVTPLDPAPKGKKRRLEEPTTAH